MPNVESIIQHAGVVSTLVTSLGDLPLSAFGLAEWHPMMTGAAAMLLHTTEPFIRVIVGTHTIIARRVGLCFVVVTIPTGHDVAKSIHRMIENAGKTKRPRAPHKGSARLRDLATPDPFGHKWDARVAEAQKAEGEGEHPLPEERGT